MLNLLEHMQYGNGYNNVPNLWYKNDNKIVCNPSANLNPDIDSYSIPLYDNKREFIRIGDNIILMDNESRKRITGVTTNYYAIKHSTTYPYLTMGSRGCPNACSYCCNNLFKKIYRGKGKIVRRRSNENIIMELEKTIRQMP